MKNSIIAMLAVLILTSCARLDSNLFNANEHKITSYQLNNYQGEVDFHPDAIYSIPDNMIHLFTLDSKAPGESNPTKIYAVYIGDLQRIATDTMIMYCHGNKDHMDFYWPRAQLLANTNGKNRYGVLMIDYRGYGLSEGKPSEEGLYADVDAGLQWLATKGLTGNRLMMYGFSMGSVPATRLTAQPGSLTPSKLLLEAPIGSSKVMVEDATGLALPYQFVTDLEIDNAELIKKVQQPLFWIHGIDDDFLNIHTEGELVYNNYQGVYKEAHRIPGANHSDIPNTVGFAGYLKMVGDFIRK
jgi:pimeloyl-ACP methyl ester carboxylesterase